MTYPTDHQPAEAFTDRRCPLPVVRKELDDVDDVYRRRVEVCGEPVWLERHESEILTGSGVHFGPRRVCGTTWYVECAGGHRLVLPDHGADDNLELIPVELNLLDRALVELGDALELLWPKAAE